LVLVVFIYIWREFNFVNFRQINLIPVERIPIIIFKFKFYVRLDYRRYVGILQCRNWRCTMKYEESFSTNNEKWNEYNYNDSMMKWSVRYK